MARLDFSSLYAAIGNKYPQFLLLEIEKRLAYAGIEENAATWLGARILLILLFSLVTPVAYINFVEKTAANAITILLLSIVMLSTIAYLSVYFSIIKRTKKVEKALPDFLMLIVSNLNAGMTPFSAFVQAARPEFGPLYREVMTTAARVGGKRTLDEAMTYLGSMFDSEVFRKSIELFLKGTKSGGHLGKLLAANAEEIRKIQDLREELISTTRTYSIFLAFIVAIVMPFLLSVSYAFLVTFLNVQSQIGTPSADVAAAGLTIFSGQVGITAEEMLVISVATLIVTSLLASLFMGIVSAGRPLYGVRYFPILAVVSVIIFYFGQQVLKAMVSYS